MTFTKKVVLLSVLHPYSLKTFERFFDSLESQTYEDFDIFLGDDNFIDIYGRKEFERKTKKLRKKIFIFRTRFSPIVNRKYLLKKAFEEGYEIFIFADSDEIIHKKRIELVCEFFSINEKEDIVFNNSVMDGFSLYLKPKITFYDILDFNVLGLGAMNFRRRIAIFLMEQMKESSIVFDWFFSLIYLVKKDYVVFLKNAKNIRIPHSNHEAEVINRLSFEMILKGIKVKKNIYKCVLDYIKNKKWDNIKTKKNALEKRLNDIYKIENFIKEYSIQRYYEAINEYFINRKYFFWWEYIVSLDKLNLKEAE